MTNNKTDKSSSMTDNKTDKSSSKIRTPCCAILGHVDVGKTKLLDYMRKTETDEASGITQQIGTTLYSKERLDKLVGSNLKSKMKIDSLLMIDTPGHECFDMIRGVSVRVADIVILMIDMIKGIEKQTIAVINMLQESKAKYIICLNKMDRIYGWVKPKSEDKLNLAGVLERLNNIDNTDKGGGKCQDNNKHQNMEKGKGRDKKKKEPKNQDNERVRGLFYDYIQKVQNKLYEYDVQSELYHQNKDQENVINIVPISAETGEGIPDLIMLIGAMADRQYLTDKLIEKQITHGYLLDSHYDKHHGRYQVALHRTGELKKGDTVIVNKKEYSVKTILMNSDNRELKDDHKFIRRDLIDRSVGYGLVLESADKSDKSDTVFEPSSVYIKKEDVSKINDTDVKSITMIDEYEKRWNSYVCPKGTPGIQIVAPSYIMMDGLFFMLKESKIDVERYKVGNIDKKDLIVSGRWADGFERRSTSLSSSLPDNDKAGSKILGKLSSKKYTIILSYDPSTDALSKELIDLADQYKVKIIHSNVVYKLIETYTKYIESLEKEIESLQKKQLGTVLVLKKYLYRTSNPVVVGVSVLDGSVKVGSRLYTDRGMTDLFGVVASIQKDRATIEKADVNQEVCLKIDTTNVLSKDTPDDTIFIVS